MNIMNQGKRIFVSGGAGVIGQELVRLLIEKGAKVFVGDIKPEPDSFKGKVLYRQGDLNFITQAELESFAPEVFFHLAATFERSEESYGHWEENYQHNVLLSHHLMTLFKDSKTLKRVVFASSYLIYDKSKYQFNTFQERPSPLTETEAVNPRNLTGLAKLAHEIELDFLHLFRKEQYSHVCARIFRGYGLDSRDVISRWVRDLLTGRELTVYNEKGWFDYIFSRDTAEGLLRLAESEYQGIVNLGTGKSRQVSDILDILKIHFPEMKINYQTQNTPLEASQSDNSLLLKILGWQPTITLEEAIPKIISHEKSKESKQITQYSNVLVTSISKKIPLLKSVKTALNKIGVGHLFGGDVNADCLGRNFVDQFWEMPKLSDLDVHSLIKFCVENKIGLIIPTRDGELEILAAMKEQLGKNGISVLVSTQEAIINTIDKLEFSNKYQVWGAIPSFTKLSDEKMNLWVVKERIGAGSQKIGLKLTWEEAQKHAEKLEKPLFQPFIEGKEYSIDCYITKSGKIKGVLFRTRDSVVNGESQITTLSLEQHHLKKTTELIEKLELYGHIVLQAIEDENGNLHFIECNARFGGASTLSLFAGLDSFYWAILESQGVIIDDYYFEPPQTILRQIRYPADQIVRV